VDALQRVRPVAVAGERLTHAVLERHPERPGRRRCGLAGGEHVAMHDEDRDATSSATRPDRVVLDRLSDVKVDDGFRAAG
jgi:hypothetical protein